MEAMEDLFSVGQEGNSAENLKNAIGRQSEFVDTQSPAKNGELIHKFLGFHMGIMGLDLKVGVDRPSMRNSHSISPIQVDLSSLNSKTLVELKVESLKLLQKLLKHTKKSRIFAFWYALLPKCAFNPCKNGILELINYPDQVVRETALDLMMELFQNSTTHLLLANAHCRAGSFTPVCLEFALALGR